MAATETAALPLRAAWQPPLAVDRKFAAIFAVSAGLHIAIGLAALVRLPTTTPALPPLVATLRLAAVVAHEQKPAAPVATVRPEARQPAARPESRTIPRAMPVARPTNVPNVLTVPQATKAMAAITAPAVETAPAKSAPAAAETMPARNAAPSAIAEASTAPDTTQTDALATYRKQLAELFARRQEYPRLAAMRGWEGEVRLRLRVARKGNLLAVVLDRSSGHDVLDRHALAMIEDMASLPALPGALAQEEIQVVVPIHYKLHKTT